MGASKSFIKTSPTVLICTGGSGGHIFPAQALAEQLLKKQPAIQIHFAGGGLVANRFFDRSRYVYSELNCGAFPWKKPLKCVQSGFRMVQGMAQSLRLLKQLNPQIVVGFGSYHTLPPLLATASRGIPLVLHAADSVPGKVIRLLSPYAAVTGIHFPDASKFLKGKVIEVEMPLREGYTSSPIAKYAAQQLFQLEPDRLTFLIFGGSQGASALNALLLEALGKEMANERERFQVLHFTGNKEASEKAIRTYAHYQIKACVKEFEARMDLAWNVADLVIGRSGASSIAEQIAFEVPGILVPYPFAADQHQEKNAEYFVTVIGGALKYQEKALTPQVLAGAIRCLMKDEGALLKGMRAAIRIHKNEAKRQSLSNVVLDLLSTKKHKG